MILSPFRYKSLSNVPQIFFSESFYLILFIPKNTLFFAFHAVKRHFMQYVLSEKMDCDILKSKQ